MEVLGFAGPSLRSLQHRCGGLRMFKVGAWDWKKSRSHCCAMPGLGQQSSKIPTTSHNKARYKQDLEAFFWSGAARRPAEDAFAS